MQILMNISGKVSAFDVEPTTRVGPCLSRPTYALCGADGITIAKIQGDSASMLVEAAATLMAKFWTSPEGLSVKQHLEETVILKEKKIVLDPKASLDELLIEASRFLILKALNSDTAPPKLASEEPPRKKARSSDPGAQLSPSGDVDQAS